MSLDLIARALFYVAAIPAGLFIGFYLSLSRWWTTDVGRIIVALCLSLLAIIALSASKLIFGDWPGRDIARIVLYVAMNIGLWHMFFALRAIQRGGTNRKDH